MYAAEVDKNPIGNVSRLHQFQAPIHYIDVGEAGEEPDRFTGLIPQEVVATKLRVTTKTLVQYRQVALGYDGRDFNPNDGIPDYKQSAADRSPDFPERKADAMIARMSGQFAREVYPDEPPFTDYEAWVLEQICKLFKKMKRRAAVETYVRNYPHLFTKEKYKCQQQ